ncbi:MAG TPA: M20/M25/M40 family metallo-hydrolase [Longimicrobium sp.]|jgi:acetylornithine deacetylase/succinyl-diaminopimelate desuccinylase-like protein
MKHRSLCLALLTVLLPASLAGQRADPVRAYVDAHQPQVIGELVRFLTIPNVASDSINIRRNAAALVEMMGRRGIRTRLLEGGGPPMVFGELPAPGARTTLLIYAHYDGQPVDTARWVGHGPWEPVLRDRALERGGRMIPIPARGPLNPEWRLYARSSSDDKGPIVAMMAALDALRASGRAPRVNLKFLFEGDEEAGSPQLERIVREHGALLRSDLVVMADGPQDPSGRPTLVFGARGITSAQITVYGPDRPLHSGHYGNWAPNPAMELARLLASMKNDSGRVTIRGWYDDVLPLSPEERAAIAALPDDEPAAFGFAVPEGGRGVRRLESIAEPSLNVRGLSSLYVGAQARTLVPDRAVAELDMRLVPAVAPARQVERLMAHVRAQGFHVVSEDPDSATRAAHPRIARVVAREGGYAGIRTPFGHPVARRVVEAVRAGSAQPPVLIPTMGGSIPAAWFPEVLGTQVILLPTVNPDNNQHAENENLRLGNLWESIRTFAAVMEGTR